MFSYVKSPPPNRTGNLPYRVPMANKCVLAKSNRAETKSNRADVKSNRAETDNLCAIKKNSLAIITNFRRTKKFFTRLAYACTRKTGLAVQPAKNGWKRTSPRRLVPAGALL